MPKYNPVTIAYQESGLIRDRQQFVTPNDAYVDLSNAYVWRGIVKRRLAPEFLARLRRCLTNQALSNTVAAASYDNGATSIFTTLSLETNSEIEPGSFTITIDIGGGSETILDDSATDGTLSTTATNALNATGGTIDYFSGDISIAFLAPIAGGLSVEVDFCYFPTEPTMGICQRELNAINAEDTIFFDTKYAYAISGSAFTELASTTAASWNGSNADFFWGLNYWFDASQNKYFWVTNGFSGGTVATTDPIRYYNGTTWNATPFLPALKSSANNVMVTAKIIVAYRGRLVALNTYEAANSTGATATLQYPNRARWSQNGDPTNITMSATGGWVDDVQGRGGYIDAPTNEHIITAAFIRDTLIVFFEHSTWKLRYTGNEVLPFVWERINIELGAESRFSAVRFDGGVLAVGDKGIVTCDGNNVRRIDDAIRDEVFRIHNDNNGVRRVQGVRNFFEQVVYWTFPDQGNNPTFPNRILLYNYDNNTWAFFNDHFTVLGDYQRTTDLRWSDLTKMTWEQFSRKWNSGWLQSQFPNIVGGNQQGFISILNSKVSEDESLTITAIATGTPPTITSPNHNLTTGEVVEIIGINGTANVLNGYRYRVTVTTANAFTIEQKPRTTITSITKGTTTTVVSAGNTLQVGDLVQFSAVTGATDFNDRTATVLTAGNTFTCDLDSSLFPGAPVGGEAENLEAEWEDVGLAAGTYIYGGLIKRITGLEIRSKKFNILNQGRKTQLGYIDFLIDKTENGQVDIPIFADYNNEDRVNPKGGDVFFNWGIETTNLPEDANIENENKVWHRMYCPIEAQFFQFLIQLSDAQIVSKDIQGSAFFMDALILWLEKGGRLVR